MKIFGAMASFRSLPYRIGRKLYMWARREAVQGPEKNGEYWLLAQVLKTQTFSAPVFLDIGANEGNWTGRAAALLIREDVAGSVHAFEPAATTYAYLSERFKSAGRVKTNMLALSDQSGFRNFYIVGERAGINSLTPVDGANVERVTSMRVDEYLSQQQISHVVLAKSDAEGHDLNILQGAADLFREGRVDVWQFEYNHRWLAGRAQLKDVFDFIADKPYRLGKLYGDGIDIYDQWHPELERYFEANYVLVRRGSDFEELCSSVRFNHRNVVEPVGPCRPSHLLDVEY